MALHRLASSGLAALLVAVISTSAFAQTSPPSSETTAAPPAEVAPPPDDGATPAAPAAEEQPAEQPATMPAEQPAMMPAEQPTTMPAEQPADGLPAASAAPDTTTVAPPTVVPPTGAVSSALAPPPVERGPIMTRVLMDVVSGAAGAAVILVLGLAVAVPVALIPWVLPQAAHNAPIFGVPISLLLTGAGVLGVMTLAVAASAAIQRLVRPLLGPEPSLLGPVIGAVFFGGVGAAIGLVASYLLVTATPEPVRGWRDRLIGDWSAGDGRAMAITGALVVGLAVPLAALGAGIGGPISAEVEDARAVEASAAAAGAK